MKRKQKTHSKQYDDKFRDNNASQAIVTLRSCFSFQRRLQLKICWEPSVEDASA